MSKQITLFMIVLYTVTGFVFIFTDLLMEHISKYRMLWGCVFLAYAVFRASMLYRAHRKEQNQNKEL
ncbi:MAG: hypothetical protein IT233_13900 [Bacteroidia bacterium]|nr:hypothetical protein [Bacteroidia bacterium]